MISSYRRNTTDSTVTQYHPLTLRMKSYENLYHTSYLLAAVEQSIQIRCCKASSSHNVFIQFPIFAKSLRNAEGLALKRYVLSLGVVMTCRLCSGPYCLSPAFHMHVDGRNLVTTFIMTRRTKHPFAPILSLQQEDSHFDLRCQFCLIYAYFENYLVQELKHHSLHIH